MTNAFIFLKINLEIKGHWDIRCVKLCYAAVNDAFTARIDPPLVPHLSDRVEGWDDHRFLPFQIFPFLPWCSLLFWITKRPEPDLVLLWLWILTSSCSLDSDLNITYDIRVSLLALPPCSARVPFSVLWEVWCHLWFDLIWSLLLQSAESSGPGVVGWSSKSDPRERQAHCPQRVQCQ